MLRPISTRGLQASIKRSRRTGLLPSCSRNARMPKSGERDMHQKPSKLSHPTNKYQRKSILRRWPARNGLYEVRGEKTQDLSNLFGILRSGCRGITGARDQKD